MQAGSNLWSCWLLPLLISFFSSRDCKSSTTPSSSHRRRRLLLPHPACSSSSSLPVGRRHSAIWSPPSLPLLSLCIPFFLGLRSVLSPSASAIYSRVLLLGLPLLLQLQTRKEAMAVVLDALAARVMKTITDMGEAKIRMLLGVSQEINKLRGNVEPLQNLLTDAERRRITDKSVQAWVSRLKSAMYEADDILDLCQLEAMDREEKEHPIGGGASCCLSLREKLSCLGCLGDILQPFLFCVKNPGFANEVGGRIKKLNDELATIRMGVADFNFIDLGSYEERRRPFTSSASYPRRENAHFVESDLVGDQIKKNTEELEHRLIADSRHQHGSTVVRVVAIVGQGGIGKSTLAKKVFASDAIKKEFKTKIWLSVTQQFTKVDLLRTAISQAGGVHGDEKDETILVNALTDTLSKNKFLLVMDDVWNQEAWGNVLRTPVLNANATQPGSRVLVTSRKDDVVRSLGASILRVNRLNDEDAWCLLKKQLPQPQVSNSFVL
ncbi:hypothetical protein ACQJBY_013186 [Aegilops geniculata]